MSTRDPEELHRLFADGMNAGDLEGVIALYESRAAFAGPDGVRAAGASAIRERLQSLLAMKPQISPTSSRMVMADDVALLFNRWRITLMAGSGAQPMEGSSTEVARRQADGSWRYVIDNPVIDARLGPTPA